MDLPTIYLAFASAAVVGCIAAIVGCVKATANRRWKVVGAVELCISAAIAVCAFLTSFGLMISAIWLIGVALLFGISGWACFAGERRRKYAVGNWINLIVSMGLAIYVMCFIPL